MNVTLASGLVVTLPIVHIGILGVPNSGKSEFASTAEKPMLIIATDPRDKMQAYCDKGIPEYGAVGQYGQPITLVRSLKTNNVIIQIEHWYDEEPTAPVAFTNLLARIVQIREEVKAGMWKTVVMDSWSQLEYLAVLRRQNGPFAGVDSVYGAAMDDCKALLISRLVTLPCYVIIILHIDAKLLDVGGGTMVYSAKAIGQLKSTLGSVLGEMYRAVASPDASAKPYGVKYSLQTQPDGRFDCGTRIGAPNGCANNFQAIFSNWLARRVAMVAEQTAATDAANVTAATPTTEVPVDAAASPTTAAADAPQKKE